MHAADRSHSSNTEATNQANPEVNKGKGKIVQDDSMVDEEEEDDEDDEEEEEEEDEDMAEVSPHPTPFPHICAQHPGDASC